MTDEKRSIPELMARLAQAEHPALRDLRQLSDLSVDERHSFWELWQQIDPDRRLSLARSMQELAEDTPELDFREIFLAGVGDELPEVRATSVQGLWEDDRTSTLRLLMRLLADDPAAQVRAAAAMGLSRFAYMAVTDDLDAALAEELRGLLFNALAADDALDVRRRALEALGFWADDDLVNREILSAAANESLLWQQSALFAMGRSLSERWLPRIQAALSSAEPPLRFEAARAAGEYGEEGTSLLPALMRLVDDADIEVAQAAIWALGQIGGEQARRTLQRVLNSSDAARRSAAEDALHELSFYENPF